MKIKFPKSARKYMGLHCNSVETDYTECPEISPDIVSLLDSRCPNTALELGAGLGRVSVYFRNKFNWDNTKFYLLDGDSGNEQVAGLHEEVGEDFYNSLDATKDYCVANNIQEEKLILVNAEEKYELPMIDVCYSFKAIGFHWPINRYLDIIAPRMMPGGYLFFELRDTRKETYTEVRWPRITRFVGRQLENIDRKIYEIINAETDKAWPVVILQKL